MLGPAVHYALLKDHVIWRWGMNVGGLGETCCNVSKRRFLKKKKAWPSCTREKGKEPNQGIYVDTERCGVSPSLGQQLLREKSSTSAVQMCCWDAPAKLEGLGRECAWCAYPKDVLGWSCCWNELSPLLQESCSSVSHRLKKQSLYSRLLKLNRSGYLPPWCHPDDKPFLCMWGFFLFFKLHSAMPGPQVGEDFAFFTELMLLSSAKNVYQHLPDANHCSWQIMQLGL